MQHTLIAVFDKRADAERARDALRAAGFSGAEVRQDGAAGDAAAGDAAAAQPGGHRFGAGIRHFFADLFGAADNAESSRYNAAVSRGQHVLTLVAVDEHEIERAADIVERHGPVDIDEETGGRFVVGAPMAGTGQVTAPGMSQQAAGAAGLQGGAAGALQGQPQQGQSQQGQPQQGQSQQRESAILPAIEEALRAGTRAVRRGGVRIYHRLVDAPAANDGGAPGPATGPGAQAVDDGGAPAASAAPVGSVDTTAGKGVAAAGPATGAGSGIGAPAAGDLAEAAPGGAGAGTGTEGYFRQHYISIYAGSGRSYDDYLPAYSYGLGKASEASYRGRAWDDVEADLRRDWEVKHPGSAWEHFKAAVRHGWEKITG